MNSKFFNYKIILLLIFVASIFLVPFIWNKYRNDKKTILYKILPNISATEQECIISNSSLSFLNKLSTIDPRILAEDKNYTTEFRSFSGCLLHKATQL